MKYFLVFLLFLILPVNSFLYAHSKKLDEYLDLAALFKESGEYEKAKGILEEAVLFSNDKKLIRYLGKLKFLSGESKKALLVFNGLKVKNWLDYLYLGLIHEDLGEIDSAISNYSKSTKLRRNSTALFRLGKIHQKKRQYKEAINFYSLVLSVDPSMRLTNYYLGECLYLAGKYKEAHKYLAKADKFYPKVKIINGKLKVVKNIIGEDFFLTQEQKKEERRRKVKLASYKPQAEIPSVKVALGRKLEKFSFSCSGKFTLSDGKKYFKGQKHKLYTLIFRKKNIVLRDYKEDHDYAAFKSPVKIISLESEGKKPPFYVLDVVYGEGNFWHKEVDRVYRGDLEIIVRNNNLTLINTLSIEEYIYGILSAEIPASSDKEALRAQAVAARTLIFRNIARHKREGFNFCADVHCQVYQGLSAETFSTKQAVDDTKGEVLIYADKPIETFYHASCGGCLSADTFGKAEYLVNKIDAETGSLPTSSYEEDVWFFDMPGAFCSGSSGSKFRWQRIYDAQDFLIVFGFELKDLKSILPNEKGDCFHYKGVDVITSKGKKSLKGDLRIRNYFDKLRSSAFKVEIKLSDKGVPKMLFFWGAGFGHGAGLCQEGAMRMAKERYPYKEILKHYYPKAKIEKIF